ncbi:MAG: C1 family peptidase, partial [Pseudomonadota bacterium]
YDAKQIWEAQQHETYMEKAIDAAKNMDFDGLKLTAADNFDVSVDSLKQKLDAGKPVYIGSMVGPGWQGTGSDGKIDCASVGKDGHAYSIVGYDDQSQQLIMKNSWGDSWGDAGYGYLSYSCLGNMDPNGFDLTLQ